MCPEPGRAADMLCSLILVHSLVQKQNINHLIALIFYNSQVDLDIMEICDFFLQLIAITQLDLE